MRYKKLRTIGSGSPGHLMPRPLGPPTSFRNEATRRRVESWPKTWLSRFQQPLLGWLLGLKRSTGTRTGVVQPGGAPLSCGQWTSQDPKQRALMGLYQPRTLTRVCRFECALVWETATMTRQGLSTAGRHRSLEAVIPGPGFTPHKLCKKC